MCFLVYNKFDETERERKLFTLPGAANAGLVSKSTNFVDVFIFSIVQLV